MGFVDLHMHSVCSDGFYSAEELIKSSDELGLSTISITDHDSVKAYYNLIEQKAKFNINLIAGVELSFAYKGRLFDILGYGIDIDVLKKWLEKTFYNGRELNNQKMILEDMKSLYSKLGIKFEKGLEVTEGSKGAAYRLMRASTGKFKENMLVAPEFSDPLFFKTHHTNPLSRFYIDETRISPSIKETIDIIHKAGGISSLAHSGAYGMSEESMRDIIELAIQNGIYGLELKYNSHSPKEEKIIKEYIDKHNLLTTGGSDYHGGKLKPTVKLGYVYDGEKINEKTVEKFLNKVKYFNVENYVLI